METQTSFNNTKVYIILALACFLAFANSISGDFVFDDTMQIVENSSIRSWDNLIKAFTTDVWAFRSTVDTTDVPPPYYRPFFTIYLTIGYQLFGLWHQGWHLMNLAIHLFSTILVYLLLLHVSENNQRLSLVASIFFALIPVHVESISWISGVPDALATLFLISSILFYLDWRESKSIKYLISSLIFFFCALFCKETAIVLPFILFCWENIKNKENSIFFSKSIKSLKLVVIFIIPIVFYLGLRISVLGKVSWKHPMTIDIPNSLIYATIPSIFITYLKNILFPFNLSLIYNARFVEDFSDPLIWIPTIIILGLIILIYCTRKFFTAQMWMALTIFVVPLLPVLNLQVFHYNHIVQDRYLYIPSIGFVWFVACLLEKLWTSEKVAWQKLAPIVVAILCVSYLIGTIWQNRMWNTEVSLWTRAIEVKPNNWTAHYNLGLAYLLEKNNEMAEKEFDKSLNDTSTSRQDDMIYVNRGLAKKELGKKDEAKKDFLKALEAKPKSIEAIINLGVMAFEQENYIEAEKQFQRGLQVSPTNSVILFNLARTLAKTARDKEAIIFYENILKTHKQDAELMYYAAISYNNIGQKNTARDLLISADENTNNQSFKQKIKEEFEKIK